MKHSLYKLALLVTLAATGVLLARSVGLSDASNREGCKNQWLFNGVWRVKVTDVQPYMNNGQQQGWQVSEVWRNGTSQELAPSNDSMLQDQTLELENGTFTARGTTGGTLSLGSILNNSFPPAGEFTYQQIFLAPNLNADPSNKPKDVLITFNDSQLAQDKTRPHFTTSRYNFRFKLDCVATGAAANAEGGSNQLAAVTGCMNQWMSNGIWKMRVTSIGTYPATLNKPSDQFGWLVTQTWVNASGRGIVSRGYCDQCPKFAGTNVTDEFLATQGGKSASAANVAGGFHLGAKPNTDWSPGESWTFQQLFSWGNFDPIDKPIRLLVTFDDKTQNATPGVPHYHKPADFRIDLTCTK